MKISSHENDKFNCSENFRRLLLQSIDTIELQFHLYVPTSSEATKGKCITLYTSAVEKVIYLTSRFYNRLGRVFSNFFLKVFCLKESKNVNRK